MLRLTTPLCLLLVATTSAAAAEVAQLASRNTEVPFAYRVGGSREWPVVLGKIGPGARLILELRRDKKLVKQGRSLELEGLTARITGAGRLSVIAARKASGRFRLSLVLTDPAGQATRQTIALQPAPPDRPISYVSDLVDDLIRIFWDGRGWRPITADAFDQYFRRLQCHGVARLIVWPGPFPVLADPANYPREDWDRFAACARAILSNTELNEGMAAQPTLPPWKWIGFLMRLRLDPSIMRAYADSAHAHGIKLSVSFRPFESGLTKYYVVPTFDHQGGWLGNFLPLASPATQFHPEQVGFANYRVLLEKSGHADAGRPATIALRDVSQARRLSDRFKKGHRDLLLRASPVAPIDETSLVLVRQADGGYRLQRYQSIQKLVEKRLPGLEGWRLEATSESSLRLTGLKWPAGTRPLRFLWLEANSDFGETIALPASGGLTLEAAAGNRLGRVNVHWALLGQKMLQTRIVGIPVDGSYRTEFQAIEASNAVLLKGMASGVTLSRTPRQGNNTLVVDLGADWSVEMVDFERPRARKEAIAEIATLLALPAFDDIFINTRSHTQLSASTGDGPLGVKPILEYRRAGKTYTHLGLDRIFAPIGTAGDAGFRRWIAGADSLEPITTWPPGEWTDPFPEDDAKLPWRFHRGRSVTRGVRRLLEDLRARFPATRIRAVIPQRAAVERATRAGLATMKRPEGGVYKSDFYRHIWSSNNHIPPIGEGMAEIDLKGLDVEPVFLGIRFAPPPGPLDLFVKHCLADLANNRGSSFRGPRGIFYEAQETLRATDRAGFDRKRESIIRGLLARSQDIREVILYEAADWTYYLPLSDPHGYLDHRTAK